MSKKIKRRKRLRIDHSKSPFNRIRNKSVKTEFEQENLSIKLQNIEQVITRTQKIIDEFEREEKREQLLKMMYQEDVSEDLVKSSMNISENELNSLVEDLISHGLLQFVSGDEVELTRDGILYMKNQGF